MSNTKDSKATETYWTTRYTNSQTGWDIGATSTPLKTYFEQLNDKNSSILIPGAGNAYEAEYLFFKGFKNVFILDIAKVPLEAFKKRIPNFPETHIIHDDFFTHKSRYDLIVEQTFFCSFPPYSESRHKYALKMHELLKENAKLVGLWFNFPLSNDMEKRPFGGNIEEYTEYFKPLFHIKTFETCYNSIPPRMDRELFGIFEKKTSV